MVVISSVKWGRAFKIVCCFPLDGFHASGVQYGCTYCKHLNNRSKEMMSVTEQHNIHTYLGSHYLEYHRTIRNQTIIMFRHSWFSHATCSRASDWWSTNRMELHVLFPLYYAMGLPAMYSGKVSARKNGKESPNPGVKSVLHHSQEDSWLSELNRLLLNTEQRVWILTTMWYFSFSFLINLQKCLHFCFFCHSWEIKWTFSILANGCNETKSEHFKGVWIFSVPTVYIQYIWVLPMTM